MNKGWKYYTCILGAQLMWPRLAVRTKMGLFSFNGADSESPVLVTTDFYLTVHRVREAIQEENLKCHLLVVDGRGINVWCGSRGGNVDTDSVLDAIDQTSLANQVSHRNLILPQLIASSVSKAVLADNGWNAMFGPVEIGDVGSFIENEYEKTREQGMVSFNLQARLENNMAHMVFEMFMFLLMTPIFWLLANLGGPFAAWFGYWWSSLAYIVLLAWMFGTFMAIANPIMPTTSGYVRGLVTGLFALLVLKIIPVMFLLWQSTIDPSMIVLDWALLDTTGLTVLGLSLFVGFNWGGSTPYLGEDQMTRDIIAGLGTLVLLFALGFYFPAGIF
ncbi:MAG: hypothetical protein AM324_009020 [Candidatus Thorarchaeota archaeon SMTZ1-83]|nr:MAG: hypothetical protein AM324_10410 [Candidatus Thorarchaeota archaeon SMTZ1-83]